MAYLDLVRSAAIWWRAALEEELAENSVYVREVMSNSGTGEGGWFLEVRNIESVYPFLLLSTFSKLGYQFL